MDVRPSLLALSENWNCLCTCVSVCLPLCLSVDLTVCLSVCQSVCLSGLPVSPPVCLYMYLCVYVCVYWLGRWEWDTFFTGVFVCLSVHLYVCLSVYVCVLAVQLTVVHLIVVPLQLWRKLSKWSLVLPHPSVPVPPLFNTPQLTTPCLNSLPGLPCLCRPGRRTRCVSSATVPSRLLVRRQGLDGSKSRPPTMSSQQCMTHLPTAEVCFTRLWPITSCLWLPTTRWRYTRSTGLPKLPLTAEYQLQTPAVAWYHLPQTEMERYRGDQRTMLA